MKYTKQQLVEQAQAWKGHMQRVTLCSVNNHVFLWAASGTVICPPDTRCDCGLYRLDEPIQDIEIPTEMKAKVATRLDWVQE